MSRRRKFREKEREGLAACGPKMVRRGGVGWGEGEKATADAVAEGGDASLVRKADPSGGKSAFLTGLGDEIASE